MAGPIFLTGQHDRILHVARAFSLNFRYDRICESVGRKSAWRTTTKQITIWGRANSVNVQKVLWCLYELDLAYERIDAGMAFGRNTEADYLAMNPNGRVPTLVEGDFVLWESNSVMRYLALAHRPDSPIYPQSPKFRAGIDRWLDWTLSTVQPVDRPVFWAMVRTPPAQRDMVAIQKDVDAEARSGRSRTSGWRRNATSKAIMFTLADIAIGAFAGAGSGSRASASRSSRIWRAGSQRSRIVRDFRNSSRHR